MRRFTTVFVALALTLGCGGDDSPVEPTVTDLGDTTLSTNGAAAFARVGLENLPRPDEPELYEVVVLSAVDAALARAEGDESTIPVLADEDGPYFNAPLHPDTPNSGGRVTVEVTDGTRRSEPLALDVEALPEAPGAFAAYVDALLAHLDQRASWAGTSIEELKTQSFADLASADPLLLPLKVAQNYLSSDEEGSLDRLVANTEGFLTADERELLDRLLGYAPLQDLVLAEVDSFDIAAPELPVQGARSFDKRACIDLGPPIANAAQLSGAMIAAAIADIAINPNGAPGRTLDALETILVGGSALPVFGKAYSAMSSGVCAWETAADFTRSVFPSHFTQLTYDFDRPQFDEDETDPGTWSNVMVTARSNGWSADEEIAKIVYDRLKPDFPLLVQIKLERARFLEPAAMLAFNSSLQSFLEEQGSLDLCPQEWTIDITGQPWSTAQVLDRKFSVDPATREVRPLEVASDVLRVAAQESEFGGQTIEEDLPIRVEIIKVTMTPDDIVVEMPGETVQFTAAIEHAKDETLGWTAAQGSFDDQLGSTTPTGVTRGLVTPTNPAAYPFLVTAESLSRQGLRMGGFPTRAGSVRIGLDTPTVRIEPPFACISPGEPQQFEAIVTGVDDYTVTWEKLEGYGSINQSGLYQSLSQGTSNARIGVTVDGFPQVRAEARVEVKACLCALDVNIFGNAIWQYESADVAYQVSNFGSLFYQFYFDPGNSTDRGIGASIGAYDDKPAPVPGDTGTWRISFAYFDPTGTWTGIWDDENNITGVSVRIDELTDVFMTGVFFGQAVQLAEDGRTVTSTVNVNVSFRAGRWGDGGWPCGE